MRPRFVLLALSVLTCLVLTRSLPGLADTTPPRGVYTYERLILPSLGISTRVAFHPDGSYAVILEAGSSVTILDWNSKTATRYDFPSLPDTPNWKDIAFEPDGSAAYLVGHGYVLPRTGQVWRLDDAAYRAGGYGYQVFQEFESARRNGQEFVAIEYSAAMESMVILGSMTTQNVAFLHKLNPMTQNIVIQSDHATSAGCMDLAAVDNEFGNPGLLVVCGVNGADALYYTDLGGVWDWRTDLGNNTTANLSRAASHGSGAYALVVAEPSRRLHRFEGGLMNDEIYAPGFQLNEIVDVAFSGSSTTALIVGRAGDSPLEGSVFEYRHDEYSHFLVTDVSIPDFDRSPYHGNSSTYLLSIAFHPDCDGGLIVGGYMDQQMGLAIIFQNTLGVSCDPATSVGPGIPARMQLHANRPNPFNPRTSIHFELAKQSVVGIRIYDLAGKLVHTLVADERFDAGGHELVWDGRDDAGRGVASGTYFYRFEAGETVFTRSMTLLK